MIRFLVRELRAWITGLVRVLPGGIGYRLRYQWWRGRFHDCGRVQLAPGCEFIAPEAIDLGDNVNIGPNGFFTADGGMIHVGAHTAFNANVHINASVGGRITIGAGCLIGPNVVMRTANHRFARTDVPIREQGHEILDIVIGPDVWLGANVAVLGGTTIGPGAVVGAGSVVTKSIPANAVAVGVPAKVIRYRGAGGGAP